MKVRDLFDQCASDYDQDRRKLVPCFDDFYGAALDRIPFSSNEQIRILDLGTGTGLFAAMVSEVYSKATLHLTDISEEMLAQAKKRFSNKPRVTFSVMNHLDLNEVAEYDLVLSALSIHHMTHCDKESLFGKIHQSLRQGGMFINADQALGPSPREEQEYEKQWLQDVRANGTSEDVLQQARERMREDRSALITDQLKWLEEAGFKNVGCWYQRYRFVVYGGVKEQS